MLDRRTARSAAAKPKAAAAAAPKAKAAATKTAAGKPAAAQRRIDEMHDYIQRRAYQLWENEGRPAGRDQAHWLQAESEIARTRGQRAGATR